MKTKLSRVLIAVISVVMMLTAVPAVDYYVSTPTAVTASAASKKTALNKSKVTVTTGDSYTLKLLSSKKKAITKSVKWSTSNKKIATVSSKGVVKAVKKGTATITAKYKGKKYKCKVTVKNPSLSATKKTLNVGKSFTLSLKNASGKKISTKNISFKSSKTSVATVSSKGVVKAKKKGTATITATYKGKKYTCKVTVNASGIANKNVVLYKGETYVQEFYDENGEKAEVSYWNTENSYIARIGITDGLITAKEAGKTRMYAKYNNEIYYFNVTVKEPSVTISKESATLRKGDSLKLTATTTPSGKTVEWKTDNKNVAVVSEDGVVTPVGGGTCNITASFRYGSLSSEVAKTSCSITCDYAGSYSFEHDNVTIYLGTRVSQTFYGKDGKDATEDINYWGSENTYIAYMNDPGTIVPVRAGTVKIFAHYEGEKYYFTVTVKEPKVSLEQTSVTLKEGESVKLAAVVEPADVAVEWESSDDTIAAVSNDGTVTAQQIGKCEITARIKILDKKYEAKCTVICGDGDGEEVTQGTDFKDPLPGKNGRTITFQSSKSNPRYKVKVDITKVQRGAEANRICESENMVNQTESGYEWCLIYADIEHISNTKGDDASLTVSDVFYNRHIYTTSGANIQPRRTAYFAHDLAGMTVVRAELYPGASGQYVIGMLIPESTGELLLKVRNCDRATWIKIEGSSIPSYTPDVDDSDDYYDDSDSGFDDDFYDDFEDTSSSESNSTAEQNFTKLKNYISSNGNVDANGKTKSLMKSFDADGGIFSAKITYNNSADEMILWFCIEPDYGSPTTVSFTMKDTTSPFVVTANLNVSDESMLATGSSTGKVTITPSQYNPQNTESFVWSDVYVASLYGDDGIREAITGTGGNATASGWLDAGNIFWNTIIRDAIGLTMKDIGFDNAAVETLEDIDIA